MTGHLQLAQLPGKLPKAKLVSSRTLLGCNPYYCGTVIRQDIWLGELAESPTTMLGPMLLDRFKAKFLQLPTLMSSDARTREFCERLTRDRDIGFSEIFLEILIAVEHASSAMMFRPDRVEFASVGVSDHEACATLVWSTESPAISKQSASVALAGFNELLTEARTNRRVPGISLYARGLDQLRQRCLPRRLTTTVAVIREAARARGIDCAYLGGSHLRLGQGRFQQEFRASVTSRTTHTAALLSNNKRQTSQRLRTARLPVPKQLRAANIDQALAAADHIGYPVVVKPLKGHGGAGVNADIRDNSGLLAAFEAAKAVDPYVLVEKYLEGKYYRLLVIDGEFVAAVNVMPPWIVGDGSARIDQLIEALNRDPFRDGFRLVSLQTDDVLRRYLRRRGLELESVLEKGKKLFLRDIANVAQGGVSIDVTDQVHFENRDLAVRTARAIGLDVAGVDLISPDIGASYRDGGCGIIEVNARPGLGMHRWPWSGVPRDVGGAVLSSMFPAGSTASVQAAVVVGDARTAVTARELDDVLRLSGRSVALALRNVAYINGSSAELNKRELRRGVRMILRNSTIDTLITTMAPDKIMEHGLQLGSAAVVALADPVEGSDPYAYRTSIETLLKLPKSKFVLSEQNSLATEAVLGRTAPDRVFLVSRRGITPAVVEHISRGGVALTATRHGTSSTLVFHRGEHTADINVNSVVGRTLEPLSTFTPVPGRRSTLLETRMFVAAMSLALGLSGSEIERAIAHTERAVR